tara:strand:- start:175 stop:297 length:123 start_codon:yes stop_codon:yes gene_type:complete
MGFWSKDEGERSKDEGERRKEKDLREKSEFKTELFDDQLS